MFVETCVTGLSWSPRARTSSSARTNFAIRLAVASGASISTLKAISGRRAATSVAPAVGWLGGPKSGLKLFSAAGLAQLRAGAAAGQLAVQIDGDAELPDLVGEHERLGARGALVGFVEIDDRRHVDGSHARVEALVARQVDARDRGSDACEHGGVQVPGLSGEREHRAMVVGIRRAVDHAGAERGRDRVQLADVATFGDVRHREQHERDPGS